MGCSGEKMSRWFLFLLLLLGLPVVLALPSLVVQVPSVVSGYILQDNYFNITVQNTGDSSAFNVSFSSLPDVSLPLVSSVSAGSVVVVQGRYHPVLNSSSNFVLTTSFLYGIIENSTPTTVHIVMNETQFSPTNTTIHIGDSVSFDNSLLNVTIVKDLLSGFVASVPAGGSFTSLFSQNQTLELYVQDIGYTGGLSVIGPLVSSYAHSAALDVVSPVTLSATSVPGQLVVTMLVGSFNTTYNGVVQGVLNIQNLGPGVANGVQMFDSWSSFEQQNFSIPPGGNAVERFSVQVAVNSTNLTNTTLMRTINVTSNNAGSGVVSYSLFVAYNNFGSVNVGNVSYTLLQLNATDAIALCSQNPAYPGCDQLRFNVSHDVVVVVNSTAPISAQSIQDYENAHVPDMVQRLENRISGLEQLLDNVSSATQQLSGSGKLTAEQLQQQLSEQKLAAEQAFTKNVVLSIIVVVVILVLCIVGTMRHIKHKREEFEQLYG